MSYRRMVTQATALSALVWAGCTSEAEDTVLSAAAAASITCASGFEACKESCEPTYPNDEVARKACESDCKSRYCAVKCKTGEVLSDGQCVKTAASTQDSGTAGSGTGDTGTGTGDAGTGTGDTGTGTGGTGTGTGDTGTGTGGTDTGTGDGLCGAAGCSGGSALGRLVFVTKATFQGGFAGDLAIADAKCQAAASAAKRLGVYKAWLSTAAVPASSRLEHAAVPYRLANGGIVANDWNDLVDGTLARPIDITEDGTRGTHLAPLVWTGTNADGSVAGGLTCGDWFATFPSYFIKGRVGLYTNTDGQWTSQQTASWQTTACTSYASLYCFEQR